MSKGNRSIVVQSGIIGLLALMLLLGMACTEAEQGEAPRSAQPDASATLLAYWQHVEKGEYKDAWELLSDEYRQRNFSGSFNAYAQQMQAMKLCEATLTIRDGILYAEVAVTIESRLSLKRGETCAEEQGKYDFELIRRDTLSPWKLNRVQVQ